MPCLWFGGRAPPCVCPVAAPHAKRAVARSARVREFSLCVPLALVVLILAVYCVAQLLHPAHTIPPQPHMCSSSFCSLRSLFQIQITVAERQITYGERTPLLLPLLLLQPFMEGMLLGVPSMVPDFDIVFPSMGSFMLNFLTASTSSTPIKCYENTQKLALLDMRGQLCMRIMLGWVLLMVADESHLSSGLYK